MNKGLTRNIDRLLDVDSLIETRKFKYFEIMNNSMILNARFAHVVLYAQMLEKVIAEYEVAFKLLETDVEVVNRNYFNRVLSMTKENVARLMYHFPHRKEIR